ncbi:MAG: transglutaminase family protein [Cephaloticoccus sp.]|nr:transglutaminase family protein [Cephaloticoccus sp.]MCF7761996.1 transglutaminase family protein [Cephaloticoccus sp.]
MTPLLIKHTTSYRYSSAVTLGSHRLLLRPRSGYDLHVVRSDLTITPEPVKRTWSRDVYGNSVAVLAFASDLTQELIIDSVTHVEHFDDQPLDFLVDDHAINFPYLLSATERIELGPYLIPSYLNDQNLVAEWVKNFWRPGQLVETYSLLDQMNRSIAGNFIYRAREEPGVQRPGQTLKSMTGSCRDFAALLIAACRFLGIPARFVSGYANTEEIPAAMGATHAWTEVYLPGAGWKGFDSTSGDVTGSKHIAVAVGRDPESLPPIAGSYSSNDRQLTSQLDVKVSVTRHHNS